jgi:hypothetical protein
MTTKTVVLEIKNSSDIVHAKVRDLIVKTVSDGKDLNLWGFDIPQLPRPGFNPNGKELAVFAVAFGDHAAWLKDTVAAYVAKSITAGNGGQMKGFDYEETGMSSNEAGANPHTEGASQ